MAAIAVLMPVYGDAAAAAAVVRELDPALDQFGDVSIVIVDDGSNPRVQPSDFTSHHRLLILTLRRNLGHQRAIAIGLAYIVDDLGVDAILVMDADGEDRVQDVPRLLRVWKETLGTQVVFAARTRRTESPLFRALYHTYRGLHRLLTGIPVRFGNFSVLPSPLASRLVVSSELWNHYAAAVLKTRLPYTSLPTNRGRRVHGRSQMNFVALFVHGLSALSVFSDTIGVRLLVMSSALLGVMILGTLIVGGSYALGFLVVPSWVVAIGALALLATLQVVTSCSVLALVVLGRRTGTDFIPARDYRLFVESVSDCAARTLTDGRRD